MISLFSLFMVLTKGNRENLNNIMITFAVGNLEIKLHVVRDSFSSWGVE